MPQSPRGALNAFGVLAAAAFASSTVHADAGPWRVEDPGTIATDRPGNGNAATTVPTGYVNAEGGLLYVLEQSEDRFHAMSFPLALRLGLLHVLELRLANALIGIEKPEGRKADIDPTDLVVGAKVALLSGARYQPDLALSVDVSLPTGRGAFTSHAVVPEARFLARQPIAKGLGLLFNVGIEVPEMNDLRFARFVYVANAHYALPVFDERWTFFVEGFGRVALTTSQPHVLQIDAGTTFLIRPRLQIDFFSQHGLSEAAPDHQFSIGFSAML